MAAPRCTDIVARTVYLPDGTRLEAHSGLGSKRDDPRFVHVKMQGATPPNVYDLKLREAFFGVRAIRLTPVTGSKMFGRDGILAHSYMLGPRRTVERMRLVPATIRRSLAGLPRHGKVKRIVVAASLRLRRRAHAARRRRRSDCACHSRG